jgi:hypothetical protein
LIEHRWHITHEITELFELVVSAVEAQEVGLVQKVPILEDQRRVLDTTLALVRKCDCENEHLFLIVDGFPATSAGEAGSRPVHV